jgi:hypothetical protein
MDLVIDDDQLENGQKETLLLIGAAKNGSVAHVRRILAKDNVDANERDDRYEEKKKKKLSITFF